MERDSGITDVADRRRMRPICVEMEKEEGREREKGNFTPLLLLLRVVPWDGSELSLTRLRGARESDDDRVLNTKASIFPEIPNEDTLPLSLHRPRTPTVKVERERASQI